MLAQVIKCTESTNGGFVVTLATEPKTIKTPLGSKTSSVKYCTKNDDAIEIGTEFDLDMSQWETVEYEGSTVQWLVYKGE